MSLSVDGSRLRLSQSDSGEEQTIIGKMRNWVFDPICAAHALGGLTRSIKGVAQVFFEMADSVHAGIGGTQFTAALLMPFGLYDLACDVAGLFTRATLQAKVDSFLGVIGGISEGADCIANFTEGLASVGAVAGESVAWAGPLGMAAAGLSAIFIAVHAKGIHANRCSLKGLKKTKNVNNLKQIDPNALISKLTLKKYRFESGAGIDVDKVIDKINAVKDDLDGDVKVKEIYKGLKTRIKEKQACHALGIVITVIGIVASAILFATTLTPGCIAGFVLLAGLYILVMAKMGVTLNSDRKFSQLVA